MRNIGILAAVAALTLSPAGVAQAGSVTTFTSLSAWQRATTGDLNRDFNSYPGTSASEDGLVDHGVTFSASNGYLFSVGPVSCGLNCYVAANLGTGNYLLGPTIGEGSAYARLNTPTYAVGLDLALLPYSAPNGTYPLDATVIVHFSSGPPQTFTVALGGPDQFDFFGLTDTTESITALSVTAPRFYCGNCYNASGGPNIGIDNFMTGGPAPEPAIWAMMLAGFGGVGAMLRRRRGQRMLAEA